MMIYTLESVLNIPIFLNNTWFLRSLGTIVGFYLKEIALHDFTSKYHIYIQNILKYIYIFVSQNILLKVVLLNFKVLDVSNIFKTFSYIFIYSILDVILDVIIDDKDKNKEMYIDIGKIVFGFVLVESFIKNKLDMNEYIYLYFVIMIYFLFYTNIDSKIKLLLKNDFSS